MNHQTGNEELDQLKQIVRRRRGGGRGTELHKGSSRKAVQLEKDIRSSRSLDYDAKVNISNQLITGFLSAWGK